MYKEDCGHKKTCATIKTANSNEMRMKTDLRRKDQSKAKNTDGIFKLTSR